ncbi:MAG: ribbon-helix-helix domain-containing protein [Candidatus Jordarchaeales archaeon]
MNEVVVSVKIPRDILGLLEKEVGRGKRSEFIRQAIMEKLQGKLTGVGDELLRRLEELEKRVAFLENGLSCISSGKLVVETHPLYKICRDENERKIVEYLLRERGATTRELEKVVGLKRRQILNKMRELASRAERELGKPVLVYIRARVEGKRQAWWLNI